LKLDKSIDSLGKRLDRLDPEFYSDNNTGLSHWKGKLIIPLDKWIELRDTPYALNYFPDDFDQVLTYVTEDKLEKGKERQDIEKWNLDFIELMEHVVNPNYGKMRCFHCLLSPDGDDPIFIGINRQYPCKVVNRFRCPYERTD
jgi:hypothetical protein